MSERTHVTVVLEITGHASIERAAEFAARWVAGETGLDRRALHPAYIEAVTVDATVVSAQVTRRRGAALRRRRERLGLTQAQLGARAGMSAAAVSDCERGRLTHLSRSHLLLADALDEAEAQR